MKLLNTELLQTLLVSNAFRYSMACDDLFGLCSTGQGCRIYLWCESVHRAESVTPSVCVTNKECSTLLKINFEQTNCTTNIILVLSDTVTTKFCFVIWDVI